MKGIWNYLFYLQWRLLNRLGSKFIQQPIHSVLYFFFPKIRKNKNEIDKSYSSVVNDSTQGFNLGFAFSHLFLTTAVIYSIICLYFNVLIDFKLRENLKYFLIGVMLLSYLTNYLLLWRKDNYLKYFKKYKQKTFHRVEYLYLVMFHLIVWTIGVFSVQWIVN